MNASEIYQEYLNTPQLYKRRGRFIWGKVRQSLNVHFKSLNKHPGFAVFDERSLKYILKDDVTDSDILQIIADDDNDIILPIQVWELTENATEEDFKNV